MEALKCSGLVGLGGAGFPAHVKFNLKDLNAVDTLIINAAECEPYITTDLRTILDKSDMLLKGIKAVQKYMDIGKVYIGIEDNKPQAIEKLRKEYGSDSSIEVVALKALYPKGAEKVIAYETCGRVIKEGQLPFQAGVIVSNVTSMAFIGEYLTTGMPLITKRLTVDGDVIKEPKNVEVIIGTPVQELMDFCGGFTDEPGKLLYGGPMMGTCIADLSQPILKNNNAVLAFSKKFAHMPKATNCIHCGRCVSHCPMNLNPTAFSDDLEEENGDKRALLLDRDHVNFCIECGSCSYVCPAHRPLAENNRAAKKYLKKYKADHAEGGKK